MTKSIRPLSFTELWTASLTSARANLVPGIALWGVGMIAVLAYYFSDAAREEFARIAEWKASWGYLYSAVATGLFGGLIPFLYLWGSRKIPPAKAKSHGLFFVLYWSARGVEVDALYRLQAWIFGNDAQAGTIVTKVAVDQFLYCPLWSAPVTAFFYAWKDADFDWSRLRDRFARRGFVFEVASVLLSIWVVWIPGTAIIYSLPLTLQVPLFNLVLCFYVLLISALGQEDSRRLNE